MNKQKQYSIKIINGNAFTSIYQYIDDEKSIWYGISVHNIKL